MVSINTICYIFISVKLRTSTNASTLFLILEWITTNKYLSTDLLRTLEWLKNTFVLPVLRSPYFMDYSSVTEVVQQPHVLVKNIARVYLTTSRLATVEIKIPGRNFWYTIPLPFSIDYFPVGTPNYPLAEKLSNILQPVCVHGLIRSRPSMKSSMITT